MDPVFDRTGKVIAWFRREEAIVDPLGQYRAFISNGAVFDYRAHFPGRLHDGNAVASIIGASQGPELKRSGTIPRPPDDGPEPERPARLPDVPRAPAYRNKWSEVTWDEFLSGKQKFIAYRS